MIGAVGPPLDINVIVQGVAAICVAFAGGGYIVHRGAKATIKSHTDDEMEHLQAIRDELALLRTAQGSSNQLMVQTFQSMDRRLRLVEERVSA